MAIFKLFSLILWLALWFIPVWAAKQLNKLALRDKCMQLCSVGALWIVGIHLRVEGKLSAARPLLVISNHLSYFDIFVLSSQAPLRYTPKSEIADWPVVGYLCKIADCVFVKRRVVAVKEVGSDIKSALARGEAVSLFAEGTTGNGLHVLPFKSSFFSLAEEPIDGKELVVQPVAFTYTHVRKLPIDSTLWPVIAWIGDASMLPHLMEVLKIGRMDVRLRFLPTTTFREHKDRKHLAHYCHQHIARAIEQMRMINPKVL